MNTTMVLAILCGVLGVGAVALLMMLFAEKKRSSRLEVELARSGHADDLRARALEQANIVAEALVKRADESFQSREQLATARLEAQLKPVADTLAKFHEQVTAVEKARAEETGGLKAQIAGLLEASNATQFEARKLSAALRRGAGVQGRWGEQTLRNVLEMAGLQNRFDFDEQASTDTEEGRRRPDVVVKMPGGGVLVIDAKCSLNAFLDAQEAIDDLAREAHYVRHGESVRGHVKGLAAKGYQNQFETSPDLVAMFVPGDGFLAAALERQPNLLEEAMRQKVQGCLIRLAGRGPGQGRRKDRRARP
jgi:DNA recombination protein RmuC